MYSSENYHAEDLLSETLYDEDLLNEDLIYESYDESTPKPTLRPIKGISVRPSVATSSRFSSTLNGRPNEYVSKGELKRSLDVISKQVDEIKKSLIDTNKMVATLDKKHTEIARIDAKKDQKKAASMQNMQFLSSMVSILNPPILKPENLKVENGKVTEIEGKKALEFDATLPLLTSIMSNMGSDSGNTGGMNPMMFFPLLLLQKDKKEESNNSNIMMMLFLSSLFSQNTQQNKD